MQTPPASQVELIQLLFAALISVVWPIYDYYIDWRRFQRELRENPRYARLREYRWWILVEWVLAASGALLWLAGAGASRSLGLDMPTGWRLWAAAAFLAPFVIIQSINVVKAIRSERTRAFLRKRVDYLQSIVPRTRPELALFLVLSVTAGICEEFLFRGYLVWVLAPLLSWWGAAVFSVAVFGLMHAYQGRKGAIQAAFLGALFTAIVVMARSLLPAMVLHALIDISSGLMTWIALTTPAPPEGGEPAASPAA